VQLTFAAVAEYGVEARACFSRDDDSRQVLADRLRQGYVESAEAVAKADASTHDCHGRRIRQPRR